MAKTRRIKRAERKHFEKYVREVARQMWLGSWLLTLRWADPADFDGEETTIQALCKYLPQYRRATITFNPELLTHADFYVREVVVHELLHCHHGALDEFIADALDGYSPEAIEIHRRTHHALTEEFLTVTSRMLAEAMPVYVPYRKMPEVTSAAAA